MTSFYSRLVIILSLIIKVHSQYTATDLCISGSYYPIHSGTWNFYGTKHVHGGRNGVIWRHSVHTYRYLFPIENWGVRWIIGENTNQAAGYMDCRGGVLNDDDWYAILDAPCNAHWDYSVRISLGP